MFFQEILEAQPDPIFGLNEAFRTDVRPNKVNLIIGIYKDEKLKAKLLSSVKKAKQQVFESDLLADYLPLDGLPEFLDAIGMVLFGEKRWKSGHGRIYAAQTIGGTGALQVGGQFLSQEVTKAIAITTPTWPNHRSIFERAGCRVDSFSYYKREKHGIDFDALCSSLKKMPEKTALILHPSCHNPTGCDLSLQEWKELSRIIRERRLIPFFDCAYQGLGEGIEKDRQTIELFMDEGHEMLVAYSCSKNFSLYCQRIGALFVVNENAAVKLRVGSQIKKIIRSLYSNPPAHGARIVATVLKNEGLKIEWNRELDAMRHRIASIREAFIQKILETGLDFEFLRHHKGMFSFIDLDKTAVQKLIEQFGIYLIDNGRVSLTGLNEKNIDYVINGIATVCKT